MNHLRFSSFFIFLDILGLIVLSQFILFFVLGLFFLTNETFPSMNINSPKYNINNKEKNDKPFKRVKINKKIGRIKKNSIIIGKHNRLSEDNI